MDGNTQPMIDLRIFYTKLGDAKYISHLDVYRCMQRAIKRARLPVWYTQGFNPHLYLTFALPLSLGYESSCETMDFRLTAELSPQEVLERLNASLPAGMQAYKAAPPVMKADQICWADFELLLRSDGVSRQEEMASAWETYLGQESLPVEKKTKKGVAQIDIRPNVQLLGLDKGGEAGGVWTKLRLSAGNQLNINPSLVLAGFSALWGREPSSVSVKKTGVYTEQLCPFE